LSGFQERVTEQNQTLNAQNAHFDGALPLEETWLSPKNRIFAATARP
jgi:hypothetical protein